MKIALEKYRRMGEDDRKDMQDWLRYIYLSHIRDDREKDRILSNFEKGEITNMISGLGLLFEEEFVKGKEEAKMKAREEKIKMVKNLIKMGLSNSQISEATDFTLLEDAIEALRGK